MWTQLNFGKQSNLSRDCFWISGSRTVLFFHSDVNVFIPDTYMIRRAVLKGSGARQCLGHSFNVCIVTKQALIYDFKKTLS